MELCVLDTRAGVELEHASLSTLGVSISPILPPPPSSQQPFAAVTAPADRAGSGRGEDAKAPASVPSVPLGTYHNAFRACEGRLYLLGRQELRAVRVQGWSQRVESLVQAGEWLEALAVALDHYEQKILPSENAAAAAEAAATSAAAATADIGTGGGVAGGFGGGVSGGSGHGDGGRELGSTRTGGGGAAVGDQQRRRAVPRSEAAEHISDLLLQYLRLAINNAPAADPASSMLSSGSSGGRPGSRINLAYSHFQMLAGVCTEFCAVTGRLDMLFGQIFRAFRARGQQE